jgi:hypothetical protein
LKSRDCIQDLTQKVTVRPFFFITLQTVRRHVVNPFSAIMSEKESAADLVDQMDFEDQPVRKYVRRSYICRLPNSMNVKRSVY